MQIADLFKAKVLVQNTKIPLTVQLRRSEAELNQLLGLDIKAEVTSRSQSPFEVATTTPSPLLPPPVQVTNGAEKIEVLLNPMGITPPIVNCSNGIASRQQSLLKPKSERVSWSNAQPLPDETPATTPVATTANGLNSSRMRLQQALKNAHVLKKNQPPAAAAAAAPVASPNIPATPHAGGTDSTSTVSPPQTSPRCKFPLNLQSASVNSSPITSDDNSATSSSSASRTLAVIKKRPKKTLPAAQRVAAAKRARSGKSPSPTSSSGDSNDAVELPEEDEEPTTLGKEAFMRVFGLCTQNYYTFLTQRRSERKRRNVTSTEKRDFHYGKLDLYEVS